MEAVALALTAVGTVAGVVAAYYAWVAVRPARRAAPRPAASAPAPTPAPEALPSEETAGTALSEQTEPAAGTGPSEEPSVAGTGPAEESGPSAAGTGPLRRPRSSPRRPGRVAYDAFVAYSHEDGEWVEAFTRRLEDRGLRIARDQVVLVPGDVLVHAVERAIRDSAAGILVCSPASMASGWARQEYAALVQRAIENGSRFIPVVIKDVELPAFAKTRYYADFRDAAPSEYDRRIDDIASALRVTRPEARPAT
ncbi:toll/interleukin-1 receptor domain-containing protein [Sphaerisporangium rhizosphaerae]|uniref:Toll/interleukin-1 receptor domain-containing protein n=1 Tax=Sphaerisporangium rhizosphaerae TaxID=2269375 RepID=A0ABW2P3T8_9ACTN